MEDYHFQDFKAKLMKKKSTYLKFLDILAVLLCVATFSPLVIPANEAYPFLLGIPYSMWMAFLISVLFVVLAYLVSLVNKDDHHAD